MQVPVGNTASEKAIAAAMSSRLGAGDARYRIGGKAGPADTVYLGVFLRSTLERLGGYDEHFDRNQDYELNQRIRDSGGTVWFDPDLEVSYRPRGSLSALARQYFDYGRWKREFARHHPGSLRPRQLAPPLLVTGLVVAILAGFWWPWAWLAVAGLCHRSRSVRAEPAPGHRPRRLPHTSGPGSDAFELGSRVPPRPDRAK